MVKKKLNRQLGYLFFIIFGVLAFLYDKNFNLLLLLFALIFLFIGIFKPNLLSPLTVFWIRFGIVLSKLFSPIILRIVYICVFLPIGIIMKLMGIDNLFKKYNKNSETYWIKRSEKLGNFEDQF